jgi:hypothetical protein
VLLVQMWVTEGQGRGVGADSIPGLPVGFKGRSLGTLQCPNVSGSSKSYASSMLRKFSSIIALGGLISPPCWAQYHDVWGA